MNLTYSSIRYLKVDLDTHEIVSVFFNSEKVNNFVSSINKIPLTRFHDR